MVVAEERPLVEQEVTEKSLRLRLLEAIYALCRYRETFTVDDLQELVHEATLPASIITGALRTARARHWCMLTDMRAPSRQREAHSRKIGVWRAARVLPEWNGRA